MTSEAPGLPILHGVSGSPFVRKVRVVLAEKQIEYTLEPVTPFELSDEFLRISPLGKIPVYQEGDFTLPDSSAICAYLERSHPEPALFPSDARELGLALFWEEYADVRVASAVGTVFFQRIVVAKILRQAPDEEAVERALREECPVVFDQLDAQLAGGSGSIAGAETTIADIALASPFVNYLHAGEVLDAGRWPTLAAYIERVHARPSFAKLIEEERAAFAPMLD